MTTVSTGQFFIIDVNDGSSLYTAAIYKQSLTQPATPSGGSYNYSSLTLTAPSSWSSTLPTATTTPTWVSYYTFSTSDKTATVTATTWTVPTIYSQKGDPGVSAKTLSVISDRQNITYDSSGSLNPSSQTTTFTALKQNTTATVTWTMTKADGTVLTASTYLSATTGDSVTLSAANFNTARGTTQGVIITGSITDGSTITDSISVLKTADGAGSIIGVLTNEATTLAADSAGTVSSFTPAGGNFIVYSATTDVSASATFSVYSQTGCTVAITAAGAYSVSAMSADTATAVFQAVYNSVTIRKTLSLSKSKSGINAITLLLIADRQTIVYDSSGNPTPSTQTTTFTAQKQNTTATVSWTMTKLDGTVLTASTYLSATTGDSVSITEANFATARGTTNGIIVKASLTVGTVTVTDTVTIARIANGSNGTNGTNGSNGSNGTNGERGSKSFYATTTATAWSDTEANAAVTAAGYSKVFGDEVTLYNSGATKWTMTKRWDGTSWLNIGAVVDGNLIVSGSITSSAIDTRNLTIKDANGNILFGSGTALDFSNVGGTTKPAANADVTDYSDNRVANSLLLANGGFNLITDDSLANPIWWGFGSNTLPSPWEARDATQSDHPTRFFFRYSGGGDFDYWSTHFQVANNTQYRVKLSMFISNDFTGLIAPLVHFPGITWALPGSFVVDPNGAFPYGHTAASWGSGAWHTLETIVTTSSQANLNWLQTRICGRVTTGYCGFFIEVTSLFGGAGQINSSNASTYIADAAIGTAYIASAAITNVKIADANVSTLKIAGNAVTVPLMAYQKTLSRILDREAYVDLISLTIPVMSTSENTVLSVSFGFLWYASLYPFTYGNSGIITAYLVSSNTTEYYIGQWELSYSYYSRGCGSAEIIVTLPPNVATTLTLKVMISAFSPVDIFEKYIRALAVKR